MVLKDRAVLVLEARGRTGEFHLMGPNWNDDLEREYLMEGWGQSIREVLNYVADTDLGGQSGFSIDAGQGQDTWTFSWTGGYDRGERNDVAIRWGDGSADPEDPSTHSKWSAPGAEPVVQAQVLNYWLTATRADSFQRRAELHWVHWTDGSIDGEAGWFGEPIPVTIQSVGLEKDENSPSDFSGRLEVKRTQAIEDLDPDQEGHPSSIPDA